MFGEPAREIFISMQEYKQRQKVIWAAQDEAVLQCGVKILDPLPYLCHGDRCQGNHSGRPLYSDNNHLSEFGSKLLIPMFRQAFEKRETTKLTESPEI